MKLLKDGIGYPAVVGKARNLPLPSKLMVADAPKPAVESAFRNADKFQTVKEEVAAPFCIICQLYTSDAPDQ